MRVFKWLGIAIGSVLVLVLLCVALVAFLFDPNDYKSDIERLAENGTHRKLTLQGDLKLSFFPWLAVEAGPAQLGERPGFGDQPFVSFEKVRLSIRLMPLLRGSIEIGDVLLDKPSIRLITDERGAHNWSDLAEGGDRSESATNTNAADSNVSATLSSLRIANGSLVLEDRKEKTRTAVRDFNLSTGKISSGDPFDLTLSLFVERDNQPPLPLKLSATVAADMDAQKHTFKNLEFDTSWYGDATAEKKKNDGVPVALRVPSLSVNTKQQTVAMEGMTLTFGDAKISGSLTGKEIFDAPQFAGHVAIGPLSPRDLMRQAGLTPPLTRDAAVLKTLSLQADVNATKTSVAMRAVELKLDDTTARGELSVIDFAAAALRFDLTLDRLDFDRYLPPAEESAAPKEASAKESAPTPIPVETLRALNARGDLRIGEAKFSGMRLAKLHLGVNARDGDVRFAPTDASLYGGDYRGSMAIDVTGKTPQLTIESHATRVDFAPLFNDLFATKKISGRGQANVKAHATGADTLAMQKSLGGTLDFNVTDGAFEGTDLWYEIKRARAVLNREAIPERSGAVRTAFTVCKGSGVLQNGVLTNNDLDMSMQFLKVGGQGTVDLVKSALDYKLNVVVLRMNEDPSAAELVDAQIPVNITGMLASPTIRPDVQGMVKARVKQEVEKQKEKVREKLQDKLQDLLRR